MTEERMIQLGKRLVFGVLTLFLLTQSLSWYLDRQFEQRTGMTVQELAK